jgi:hypothetical protein
LIRRIAIFGLAAPRADSPVNILGINLFPVEGLKVRILSPSAASQRRTRPAALGVAPGDSLVYKQFPEHETKAGHVELSAKFAS